ncbi:hypothetical protein F5Y19DRAFT_320085 [Xylariaceae sp. FL1651]|nr:hypothetical protein F5Y19DRAFT_320085 [Xylariaceae sp. FL1651]
MLLTELPPEIINHILGYVDPLDLAWIPRTCRALYHAVTANTSLFKLVYLNHLDAPSQRHVNWEQSLKDLVRLQNLCRCSRVDVKKKELDFVHRTVTSLLRNAATHGERPGLTAKLPQSRNADLLARIFAVESNQSAFLCRSFIYERARAEFHVSDNVYFHGPPKLEHQQSAHLHCLYGVPQLSAYPSSTRRTRHSKMHPFACSKVYDLRQYTDRNKWGPFMDDGTMRVDWEKVEAIMIVLGANMEGQGLSGVPMCESFCSIPFAGTWPNSWKSPHIYAQPRELDPLEHLDPYDVTGVWLRVVCFLDYTDFFAYNFAAEEQPPSHVPRPAIDVGEATRLILMRIFVTAVEPPGPEDGQDLPVVHFKGVSRSLDHSFDENADSDIRGITLLRGSVRLTPEGEVRWTTFSIFGGVERWRSESVQVGGVKSAKGVLGHWFDKDYDPRGPAGPTAFWKISDNNRPKADGDNDEIGASDLYDDVDELDGDYEGHHDEEDDSGEESLEDLSVPEA